MGTVNTNIKLGEESKKEAKKYLKQYFVAHYTHLTHYKLYVNI